MKGMSQLTKAIIQRKKRGAITINSQGQGWLGWLFMRHEVLLRRVALAGYLAMVSAFITLLLPSAVIALPQAPTGFSVRVVITGLGQWPQGVDVDLNGNVYVVNNDFFPSDTGTVYRVVPIGDVSKEIIGGPFLNEGFFQGIKVAPNGDIFVSSTDIVRKSSGGGPFNLLANNPTRFDSQDIKGDLALRGAKLYMVGNEVTTVLWEIDTVTGAFSPFLETGLDFTALAYDSSRDVFIAGGTSGLFKIDPLTGLATFFAFSDVGEPITQPIIDPDTGLPTGGTVTINPSSSVGQIVIHPITGEVYFTTLNDHEILKVTRDGVVSVFSAGGFDSDTFGLNTSLGLAFNAAGDRLYVTDRGTLYEISGPFVPAPNKIFWTDANNSGFATTQVRRANTDGTAVESLVPVGGGGVFGPRFIALDAAGDKMYWAVIGGIVRANLDGTGIETLVRGLPSPMGIALAVAVGKMYWTDESANKIQRADLNGSNVEDLVTGLAKPRGLALDLVNGRIYWTTIGATKKIQRANLDGTNVEDLVTGLFFPRGIALDVAGGKMYWADGREIHRANLDGSFPEIVAIVVGLPLGLALDVSGGKMYWTELFPSKIRRANLDGSSVQDLVAEGLDTPWGIAVGLVPEPLVADTDGDGIADAIDTQPTVPSAVFSDGITFGLIPTGAGIQVSDAPDPAQGVIITAPAFVTISACSTIITTLFPSTFTVTCGSAAVQVESGSVTVTTTIAGATVTATVGAGGGVRLNPEAGTVENIGETAINLTINGAPYTLNPGQTTIPVTIDIKPGSFPNTVKLGETGSIPVAIFGTATFDVRTIQVSTLHLQGASVRLVQGKGLLASYEDVNLDGVLDLVVQFDRGEVKLTEGDSTATVTGDTSSGGTITGTDSVRVIP